MNVESPFMVFITVNCALHCACACTARARCSSRARASLAMAARLLALVAVVAVRWCYVTKHLLRGARTSVAHTLWGLGYKHNAALSSASVSLFHPGSHGTRCTEYATLSQRQFRRKGLQCVGEHRRGGRASAESAEVASASGVAATAATPVRSCDCCTRARDPAAAC